jgi:hypothetical protein|tara:strand:+ start:311 stop:496 length:186 start_codon:yes stop_codon:yes gene_type:complete
MSLALERRAEGLARREVELNAETERIALAKKERRSQAALLSVSIREANAAKKRADDATAGA